MDVFKDFLRDTLKLEKEDIYNVDTKDTFSFFNSDAQLTEFILQTFTEFKVDGRFINVEVSKTPEVAVAEKEAKRRGKKVEDTAEEINPIKVVEKGSYGKKEARKSRAFIS